MASEDLTLRHAGADALPWLLGLFDEVVAWLVDRGQGEQWGTVPWSRSPARRARLAEMLAGGGLRVAALDGTDVAALLLGDAPSYVLPSDAPELYVLGLIVSRAHAGRGIGERLIARAVEEARHRGAEVLRVDCWAGAPTLVAWYEARGFARAGRFTVNGGWTGQVFAMAV